MEVEILRHWKRDDEEYGEYYIHYGDGKYLCFQNGNDIKILGHWKGRSVRDCVSKPTRKVIDAILLAIGEDKE